jgi:hypothetical protein
MRDLAQRRRDAEATLDAFVESSLATEGDVATREATLIVADDLIDYVAAYCEFGDPEHKTSKGTAWRETAGSFRSVKLRLATAVRRYMEAA